ncbi:MAG: hypothetical protein H0X27_00455 [Caulobacteraceae bacterium]|nr:hypothetical protein [Caulobacteraceae bacterium]
MHPSPAVATFELTALERAVLDGIREDYAELQPALDVQLDSARVLKRRNSGVGFFTNLEIDGSAPPLLAAPSPLNGREAIVSETPHGMGFVLWLSKDGFADFLEGFTYGDSTVELDLPALNFELEAVAHKRERVASTKRRSLWSLIRRVRS